LTQPWMLFDLHVTIGVTVGPDKGTQKTAEVIRERLVMSIQLKLFAMIMLLGLSSGDHRKPPQPQISITISLKDNPVKVRSDVVVDIAVKNITKRDITLGEIAGGQEQGYDINMPMRRVTPQRKRLMAAKSTESNRGASPPINIVRCSFSLNRAKRRHNSLP